MNIEKIGGFIKEKRNELGLTQKELAERLGVSDKSISKWENGKCLPDFSIFNDLCKELKISINELLAGEVITEEEYRRKFEEGFINTFNMKKEKKNI